MGLHVALVGLRFGAEFLPIYLHHPDVTEVTICDTDASVLSEMGGKFGVERRASRLEEVLDTRDIDAVHLVTPIPLHAGQTLAVLGSGRHCACTVPAATSIEDLQAIVAARKKSGRKYMMMETAVYTRGFLLAKDMLENGEIGRIQLLRGAHYQDMENWPDYWLGLPPMHYATHAVSPLLALAGRRATGVHCFGSGVMREDIKKRYGNPYPAETAIFRLEGGELAAEVTRTLFETARAYTEAFSVYGDKASFEWQQLEKEEDPLVFRMGPPESGRGRSMTAERVTPSDRAGLLPEEIARFTQRGVYDEKNPHQSFIQGGGHHGSHPHLVHEFVRAIVEDREPYSGAVTAANWTAAGVCAHQSAMAGGELVEIPAFE